MRSIKGFTLALFVIGIVIPVALHAQPGNAPPQNVNVVNTPNVNVVNTPNVNVTNPVGLANGTTVGINPSSNTVKIDGSTPVVVREAGTVVVFDQTVFAPALTNLGPIDVSAFKQIRVVIRTTIAADVSVTPKLNLPTFDAVPLDDEIMVSGDVIGGSSTKTYDIPGQSLSFRVFFNNNLGACRVIVYGRSN